MTKNMYVINNKSNGVVRMYVANFVTINRKFVLIASRYIHTHYAYAIAFIVRFLVRMIIKFGITKEKKKEEDAIKRPQQNF